MRFSDIDVGSNLPEMFKIPVNKLHFDIIQFQIKFSQNFVSEFFLQRNVYTTKKIVQNVTLKMTFMAGIAIYQDSGSCIHLTQENVWQQSANQKWFTGSDNTTQNAYNITLVPRNVISTWLHIPKAMIQID